MRYTESCWIIRINVWLFYILLKKKGKKIKTENVMLTLWFICKWISADTTMHPKWHFFPPKIWDLVWGSNLYKSFSIFLFLSKFCNKMSSSFLPFELLGMRNQTIRVRSLSNLMNKLCLWKRFHLQIESSI